jgi:diguanylate cyclase (GGDEF)-like protein/PAS domain S-box-containing protein
LFDTIIDGISGIVYVCDDQGRLVRWNDSLRALSGYTDSEIAGIHPRAFVHPEDQALLRDRMEAADRDGRSIGEVRFLTKGGVERRLEITGTKLLHEDARYYVGMGIDVTEHRATEARLYRLAHFDTLTELPNRYHTSQAINAAVRTHRDAGTIGALVVVDLFQYRLINDSLGHAVGDALLAAIAQRIGRVVGEDAFVGRIGGDEFGVLTPHIADRDEAMRLAQKIGASFAEPFWLDERELYVMPSMGVVIVPADGDDAATLIRNADLALGVARERGVHARFYDVEMSERVQRRLDLETQLRRSVRHGEFSLVYQPEVEVATGRTIAFEALVRWHHPQRGLIPPEQFVRTAEETGLILPLGEWVLREAARTAIAWNAIAPAPVRLSVNLSAEQIRRGDIVATVSRTLERTELPPELLELEITEGVMLEYTDEAFQTLTALKALGVSIAIDDFGTGYSSLSYLQRFPIDRIKIDRSFVRDLTENPRDAAIVDAIVLVAIRLGLDVIAEGVETPTQLDALRAHGCAYAQGFLYSQPMSSDAVVRYLMREAKRHS